MKSHSYPHLRPLLAGAAALLLTAVTSLRAEASAETEEAEQMDALAKTEGSTKVADSLSNRFATFAGSQANATALVTGLQSGGAINLTATVDGQATVTTFTPPTGKMGYGNVFISLALAQEQLTKLGITQPTPAQIEAALDGGSVTTGSGATAKTTQLSGILVLRNEGKGWGKIAKSIGVKLGPVVSDLRVADQHLDNGVPHSVHAETPEHLENPAAAASARPDLGAAGRPEIPHPPSVPMHH